MRSFWSYGTKTASLMKETICWHIRYLSLSIWGTLQFRHYGDATTEECLEHQIEQARLGRRQAAAKLAETRKVGVEVEALSRSYWHHIAGMS
jgi:hypothetical protein